MLRSDPDMLEVGVCVNCGGEPIHSVLLISLMIYASVYVSELLVSALRSQVWKAPPSAQLFFAFRLLCTAAALLSAQLLHADAASPAAQPSPSASQLKPALSSLGSVSK